MRILHFLGMLKLPRDPEREIAGGITRVALELARAQQERGHESWVVTVGRDAWSARWHGVRLRSLRIAPWARLRVRGHERDFRARLPLIALTWRRRFDVVQGHQVVQLRHVRAGLRVAHLHNDPFAFSTAADFAHRARHFWMCARGSDAQAGVSRYIVDRLARSRAAAAGMDVGPFVPRLIYNAVRHERFAGVHLDAARQRLRAEWCVGEQDTVFAYVGAVSAQKGVGELVRAFAAVAADDPRARLAIVGGARLWGDNLQASWHDDDAYEREIRAELAPLERAGRARWFGVVDAATLPSVYAMSDVVVLPSLVEEAFGLAIAEGLASGKPVIASRIGGVPELVRDANGLLVPPGDVTALAAAMRALAGDAALRTHLAGTAREGIARFTWDAAARELDALYAECLGTPSATPQPDSASPLGPSPLAAATLRERT